MFKDAVLNALADKANVAQFVSFGPDLKQRFSRVRGCEPNLSFGGLDNSIRALLQVAPERSVNVRSFTPDNPKSREFIYGLKNVVEGASVVRRLAGEGLHTIVNETVDVHDGGVSGVMVGEVIEFAPGDTPRCVEKPGTVSFRPEVGLRLLEKVYKFHPTLDYDPHTRVEFSLHPLRRGYRHEHVLIWELEEVGSTQVSRETNWPNLFSRFIGDKAFGLLVADTLDLPVPATTVFPRFLAPFGFGRPTKTGEPWIRTCPLVQDPGHFTTQRGWCDPFQLMAQEDPKGKLIASILAQEGVDAAFSGSLVAEADGGLLIEGTPGYGDKFMVGLTGSHALPEHVLKAVRQRYEEAREQLGPVRMEWVYDKNDFTWIVQLHRGITTSQGSIIHQGEAEIYEKFDVTRGIDQLRMLIAEVRGTGKGIILVGNVGVTSHLGDLLRKAQIPSYLERAEEIETSQSIR
jgi:hypothetical protein